MKLTILLLFCGIILGMVTETYSQGTIEQIGEQVAENVYKQIKSKIPSGSKIAVLYFEAQKTTGTEKTMLGIRISEKVSSYLVNKFNNKEIIVLFPVNTQAKRYFSPPADPNEAEIFYKKFNENRRPDYFITAKYYFSPDMKTITCSDIIIQENPFIENSANKAYSVLPVPSSVNQSELNELKCLNIVYSDSKDDDFLNKIIQFSENNEVLFTCDLYDLKADKILPDNGNLIIGHSYAFKITIFKDCYLYVLNYNPEDKEHTYIIPLFPYKTGLYNKCEPGDVWVPSKSGFEVIPPPGPAYFKIIASLKPLTMHMTSVKDKNDFTYTKMSPQDTEMLWHSLNTTKKQMIPIHTELKTYYQKY